jgi:NAD(P)H-dependent flavin oxidoreductase YrpB (nitropropane dioxygenase family)
MCTVESPIHHRIKERIVAADENQTALVLRRWRNTSRLFRNKVAEDAIKVEKESTTGEFSEVAPFVSGKRGREVFLNGDAEHGVCSLNLPVCGHETNRCQVWTAGQAIGLIHDIPTCDELLSRMEREALDAMERTRSLYTTQTKL